jgi:proteasome lid subunit RPN8/RPN11
MRNAFRISPAARQQVIAHARETKPAECCGVLLGSEDEIVEAIPTRNLADEPTRYLIDPQGHIDALRSGRQRGLDVIGFYHSHPHSPAIPSPRDLSEAVDRQSVYLIVGLAEEPPEVRLFRLAEDGFFEMELAR